MTALVSQAGSPTETTAAPEGHEAAMIAKADDAQAKAVAAASPAAPEVPAPASPERPAALPEKFQSVDDLAKAYAELEAKLSKGDKPAETPAVEAPKDAAEAAKALESKGLDYSKLEAEFSEKGDLSAESRAALEQAGIPKDMVDAYIAGQRAQASAIESEVFGVVGGADAYGDMVKWAGANLSTSEIAAYNAATSSKDMNAVKLAVAGLHARFKGEVGSEPKLLNGGTQPASGEAFRSTRELTAAMRDPRYATDPAYRADVERKLAGSSIL